MHLYCRETAPFRVTREQMEKVNQLHVLGIVAAEVRLKQTGEINHLIGDVGRTKENFKSDMEK